MSWLPDVSKKMLLSACSGMRAMMEQCYFHDPVNYLYLQVCPHPEKHFSLLVDSKSRRHRASYSCVIPRQIMRLELVHLDRYIQLDMSQCTALRELSIPYGCYMPMMDIRAPDSVQHLVLHNSQGFRCIREMGLGQRKIRVGHIHFPERWKTYEFSVPAALKTLTVVDVDGRELSVTVPHQSHTLTVEFAA